MDQAVLVNDLQTAARQLVTLLTQEGFPLTAAFWYWEEDDPAPRLALVSSLVDEHGAPAAYERIDAVLRAHPELASLWLRVWAIGAHDRRLERARRGLVTASFLIEPPVQAA